MLLGLNTVGGAECGSDDSFNWMLGCLIVGAVTGGIPLEIVLPAYLCESLQAILLFPCEAHQYLSYSNNQFLF